MPLFPATEGAGLQHVLFFGSPAGILDQISRERTLLDVLAFCGVKKSSDQLKLSCSNMPWKWWLSKS